MVPPIVIPTNPIGAISTNVESLVSLTNSIERICVSNNMCEMELSKIRYVTKLVCKKIKTQCAIDILNILTEYNYIQLLLETSYLNKKTKEELISKLIENIQRI